MAKYTDDFNRSDADPISGSWSTGYTGVANLQIVGNEVRLSSLAGGLDGIATYTTAPGADQWAKATLATFNDSAFQWAGELVRFANPSTVNGYGGGGHRNGDGSWIVEWTAGTMAALISESVITWAATDNIVTAQRGSTLCLYKNGGVPILSFTDSTLTSGRIGQHVYTTTALGNAEVDNFTGGDLPITLVAAGTEGEAASGNCTPGLPAGIAANDILICTCHSSDQVAHTMTGSWTQIVQGNGGGTTSRLSVWYHRYDGSTTPSAVITHASGSGIIAGIAAFRGCKTSGSPVNVTGTIANGTDATIEHNGVTVTVDGSLLLAINGAADDNNRTLLSGWTNVLEDVTASTQNAFIGTLGTVDESVSMFYVDTFIGATGTVTVTQAAADPWASVLIALEPEPVATNTAITPSAGSLLIVGNVPVAGTSQSRTPLVGLLSFSGKIAIVTNYARAPPAGEVYFGLDLNPTRTPLAGTLAITGVAPTLSTGGPANTSITPVQGSLSLTGRTPGVSPTPSAASLSITGIAPTVQISTASNTNRTPTIGALVIAGIAPTVQAGANVTRTPGTGEAFFGLDARQTRTGTLSISGNAPTLQISGSKTITPGAGDLRIGLFGGDWSYPTSGALTITGNTPTIQVSAQVTRTPTVGALTLTGIAPTVQVTSSGNTNITPTVGALAINGAAPSLFRQTIIPAQTGTLIVSGNAPNLQISSPGNTNITPNSGTLTLAGAAATLGLQTFIRPLVGALSLAGGPPALISAVSLTPSAGTLTLAGVAPIDIAGTQITPSAGALTLAGAAPTFFFRNLISPSAGALALAGNQPSIQISSAGNTNITPQGGALNLVGAAPSLQLQIFIRPLVGALALAGNQPTIQISIPVNRNIGPGAGNLNITGYQPMGASVVLTPGGGGLVLTGNQPPIGAVDISGALVIQITLTGKVIGEQIILSGKAINAADITGKISH